MIDDRSAHDLVPYASLPFAQTHPDPLAVSPLARLQARHDRRVTNLRHEPMQLDTELARLVQRLDGTRDRAAVALGEALEGDPEAPLQRLAKLVLLLA